MTREIWDAIDKVVVGYCVCATCGTEHAYTRKPTKAEAAIAQVHDAPVRSTDPSREDVPA